MPAVSQFKTVCLVKSWTQELAAEEEGGGISSLNESTDTFLLD